MRTNQNIPFWSRTIAMLLIGSWLSGSFHLQAQSGIDPPYREIHEEADRRYLPSDLLLNGEKYNYPYRTVDGTPFYEIPGDPLASVQYGNETYSGQRIRYDIYNQVMVLEFEDISGARGSLVLQHEQIREVEIGTYRFRWFTDKEGSGRYGQVIGEGAYQAVFFWEKQYLPDLENGKEHYFFSDPVRTSFLSHEAQMCPFKRNRSFVKCFPEPVRDRVKAYLKTHRIRIRKAPPEVVGGLMFEMNLQEGND
ncbi:MAG: hypothetical protein ACWGNV_01095 [Bacteroidales bacterium]